MSIWWNLREAWKQTQRQQAETSVEIGWVSLLPWKNLVLSDHPAEQNASHLTHNLGLNYHPGQGSWLSGHTSILWFAILPTVSALSFNSEKAFQQGQKGHRNDLKLWGRRSFPFPDLPSATQFEVPFFLLALKKEKLLNCLGVRVVKNLIISSLLSPLRMHFLVNILATNHF